MKIDEACIDHNVSLLVKYITDFIFEYDKADSHLYLLTLGEIRGMIDLSDKLKEVLRE